MLPAPHPVFGERVAARYLTVKQVADLFCVNDLTVRRWIADGKLPATRIGKRAIRISFSDVCKFIEDRRLAI